MFVAFCQSFVFAVFVFRSCEAYIEREDGVKQKIPFPILYNRINSPVRTSQNRLKFPDWERDLT